MSRKSANLAKYCNINRKVNMRTENLASLWKHKNYRTTYNAISPTQLENGDDIEIKKDTKKAPRQEMHLQEDLYGKSTKGEFSIGIHRGLDLPDLSARVRILEAYNTLHKEKISWHKEQLSCQQEKLAWQQEKLVSHEADITELKDRLLTPKLELPSEDRPAQPENRSISTFKSGKFGGSDRLESKNRWKGNETVYFGDAAFDATLYTSPGGRDDVDTFKALYGLDPLQVSRMSDHFQTMVVLNTHAGVISSPYKVGSKKFCESFAEFIRRLKDSDFDESYLDEREPDEKLDKLESAYWSFIECAASKVEVRRVRKVD